MISQLVDIEWKFGVTASSSYIDKVGNAFLQLKVVYDKGGLLESKFMGMKSNVKVIFNSTRFLLTTYSVF